MEKYEMEEAGCNGVNVQTHSGYKVVHPEIFGSLLKEEALEELTVKEEPFMGYNNLEEVEHQHEIEKTTSLGQNLSFHKLGTNSDMSSQSEWTEMDTLSFEALKADVHFLKNELKNYKDEQINSRAKLNLDLKSIRNDFSAALKSTTDGISALMKSTRDELYTSMKTTKDEINANLMSLYSSVEKLMNVFANDRKVVRELCNSISEVKRQHENENTSLPSQNSCHEENATLLAQKSRRKEDEHATLFLNLHHEESEDTTFPGQISGLEENEDRIYPGLISSHEETIPPGQISAPEENEDTIPPVLISAPEENEDIIPPGQISGHEEKEDIIPPRQISGHEENEDTIPRREISGHKENEDIISSGPISSHEENEDGLSSGPISGHEKNRDTSLPRQITLHKESTKIFSILNTNFSGRRRVSSNHSTKKQIKKLQINKTPKKTKRPCLYCEKFQSNLTKHLLKIHKNEPDVEKIAKINDRKQRDKLLLRLRIRGIDRQNEVRLREGQSPICLRKQSNETRKRMCLNCRGIFSSRSIYLHLRNCYAKNETVLKKSTLPIEKLRFTHGNVSLHEEFNDKVMEHLRFDEIGTIVRMEPLIRVIGNDEFERIKEKKVPWQTRRKVLSYMRRMARLHVEVNLIRKLHGKPEVSFDNFFDVEIYEDIKAAFQKLASPDTQTKTGSAKLYDTSLKKASVSMISYYREKKEDSKKDKAKEFLAHYSHNSQKIVAPTLLRDFSRCILRRAENIPRESEVEQLKKFILQEFDAFKNTYEIVDQNSFIRLRRAVICRLTFFNGWRPAEVSGLTVEEWQLAKKNACVTDEQKMLKVEEKQLLDSFRVVYNSKNFEKEISVFVPKSCFGALDILANEDIRKSVNVAPENPFLFPPCRGSLDPVSGYYDIMKACRKAKLEQNLCADKLRHLVSTEVGTLDLSTEVKSLFFKHVGHSKAISESFNHMPRALKTVLEIIPLLRRIDERNSSGTADHTNDKNIQSTADLTDDENIQLTAGSSHVSQPNNALEVYPLHSISAVDADTEEIQGQSPGRKSVFGSHSKQKHSQTPVRPRPLPLVVAPAPDSPDHRRGRRRPRTSLHDADAIGPASPSSPRVKRSSQRVLTNWTEKDKKAMKTFFYDYIYGAQKSYPGALQVNEFFVAYPKFLESVPYIHEKKKRLRGQLNNMRKNKNKSKRSEKC